MAKLKNPLLSLGAVGRLAKDLTFRRSRHQNIAESTPIPEDARSLAQLSWRHMYQKAVALWHALSADEKQEWESLARHKHMTGFAWFISQALKPNPGLYLPLQGGTMAGDIDMAKNKILRLPLPTDSQEPLTLAYFTANIAPYLYNEGARVFHNANQSIPNLTATILAFNSERYDTDTIHDPVINNSRLTAKTAGKYVIIGNIFWTSFVGGRRTFNFRLNGATIIANEEMPIAPGGISYGALSTIYDLALNDYIELAVFQSSGAGLSILVSANFSPEFMMQRIG